MSNSLTIGVDIDGVLADYVDGLRNAVAVPLHVSPKDLPDPMNYSFSDWGEHFKNDFVEYHSQAVAEGLYFNLAPISQASETINRLAKQGHYIRIITSRFVKPGQHALVARDTTEWLDKS